MLVCLSKDLNGANVAVASAPLKGAPIDISILGGDWEIVIHVLFLTPEKKATLHVLDSENNFVNSVPGPTFNLVGPSKSLSPIKHVVAAREYPSLRFGKPNAKLRLDLVSIDAGASIRYSAFVRTPDV